MDLLWPRGHSERGLVKRVFIAVPNLGTISTGLTLRLIQWSHRPGVFLFLPSHIQPHDRARNKCVHEFLQRDEDYLFFIDADTVPPARALAGLLAHNVDIVGATVLTWKDGGPVPVAFHWSEEHGGYRPAYGKGLMPVDVVTCACTLISRRVLEAFPSPPFAFENNSDGDDGYGEDFVFCRRAKALGFQPYVDSGLLCSHYKTIDLAVVNQLLVAAQSKGGGG